VIRGLSYFALVFGAGFLLGPIRVLWLVPRVGERFAELIESPVMLAVIVLSARWLVARFPAVNPASYLGSGALALLLALTAESLVVVTFRDQTILEYVSTRDPISGAVYLCLLIAFALMPRLLGKATSTRAAA